MFESWHPYPLVRILLPFALGILASDFLHWSCPPGVLIFLLTSLSFWSRRSLRPADTHLLGVFLLIWLGLAGTTYPTLFRAETHSSHWTRIDLSSSDLFPEFSGQIRSVSHRGHWQRLTLAVKSLSIDDKPNDVCGLLLVYMPEEGSKPLQEGQFISFSGMPSVIQPPSDPFGFDWRRYNQLRGISYQVFLKKQPVLLVKNTNWRSTISSTRTSIQHQLDATISDTLARQLLSAIMLGARDEMGPEVSQAYQASGAVHILAVSGLHVGLVAGMAMILLGFLWPSRRHHWFISLPVILLVWAYILLTGAADSALRAGVLFTFLLLGKSMRRYGEGLNLLAGAVLLLLIIDPRMIFHVGFQLSVLAVGGIIVLHPLIFRAWTPPGRVIGFFWNLTAVTLAAQAATLVISLYYFHQLPVYFLLSGLFIVPLSGLLLGSGWGLILIHGLFAGVAQGLAWIPETLAKLMNAFVFSIASLPGSISTGWSPAVWWAFLAPVIIASLLYAFRYEGRGLIPGMIALALGLGLDVGVLFQQRTIHEWGVIRRQGEGVELMVRHQGDCLLMDLSGERTELQRVNLPGYGSTWLTPNELDIDFGPVVKRGQVLSWSQEKLSWGSKILAPIHVCQGRPKASPNNQLPSLVLLPWGMRFKDRLAWQESTEGEQIDLRDNGYWVAPIWDGLSE